MAELKTKATTASVDRFLDTLPDDAQRADCRELIAMMKAVTKAEPKMWGTRMVGFGEYAYTYASGHGGTFFLTGFAPRKKEITLYLMAGLDRHRELLGKLGKHSGSKSCLYIKRLDDVDRRVLKQLIAAAVKQLKAHVAAQKALHRSGGRRGPRARRNSAR